MDNFYVESDMQGNFLISYKDSPLFIIFYSEKEMVLMRWGVAINELDKVKPNYYYLNGTIYLLSDDSTSILSHDSSYFKIIEQVIKRTYPGTITLAYEDLTKETL